MSSSRLRLKVLAAISSRTNTLLRFPLTRESASTAAEQAGKVACLTDCGNAWNSGITMDGVGDALGLFWRGCLNREMDGCVSSSCVGDLEDGGGGPDKYMSEREACRLYGQLLTSASEALIPPGLESSLSDADASNSFPSFSGLDLPNMFRSPILDSRLASLSDRGSARSGSSLTMTISGRARRMLLECDCRDSKALCGGLEGSGSIVFLRVGLSQLVHRVDVAAVSCKNISSPRP